MIDHPLDALFALATSARLPPGQRLAARRDRRHRRLPADQCVPAGRQSGRHPRAGGRRQERPGDPGQGQHHPHLRQEGRSPIRKASACIGASATRRYVRSHPDRADADRCRPASRPNIATACWRSSFRAPRATSRAPSASTSAAHGGRPCHRKNCRFSRSANWRRSRNRPIPARTFVPTTDIFETEQALTLVVEMPGVDKSKRRRQRRGRRADRRRASSISRSTRACSRSTPNTTSATTGAASRCPTRSIRAGSAPR